MPVCGELLFPQNQQFATHRPGPYEVTPLLVRISTSIFYDQRRERQTDGINLAHFAYLENGKGHRVNRLSNGIGNSFCNEPSATLLHTRLVCDICTIRAHEQNCVECDHSSDNDVCQHFSCVLAVNSYRLYVNKSDAQEARACCSRVSPSRSTARHSSPLERAGTGARHPLVATAVPRPPACI